MVATVRGANRVSVFLDLKLHYIPATVAGAARAVSRLRPEILTVHAAGGTDVIRAAVYAAAPVTCVAAVTVLTSMSDRDLAALGIPGPVSDVVRRMAVLAVAAGARGLMQIMPDTAGDLNLKDVFDPKENIAAGSKYLKQLLDKYKGDNKLALAAYNAGSAAVDAANGVPDIQETRDYVDAILKKIK